MNLRIGHVEVFVEDPVRSMAFYRDVLGFEVVEVQRGKYVWLKLADAQVLLRPGRNPVEADEYAKSPQAIVLYTDDLNATLATLKSRGLEIRGHDGPPCCPTFTDPDGHWFQLVNPAEQSQS
jgi:catechol 2,3-dioxygenase-like lactoylglutathione lyase family enzyme